MAPVVALEEQASVVSTWKDIDTNVLHGTNLTDTKYTNDSLTDWDTDVIAHSSYLGYYYFFFFFATVLSCSRPDMVFT